MSAGSTSGRIDASCGAKSSDSCPLTSASCRACSHSGSCRSTSPVATNVNDRAVDIGVAVLADAPGAAVNGASEGVAGSSFHPQPAASTPARPAHARLRRVSTRPSVPSADGHDVGRPEPGGVSRVIVGLFLR